MGYDIDTNPVVGNGKIFINAFDRFICVDADSGRELWQNTLVDAKQDPCTYGRKVYVSDYYELVCCNADTGEKLWEKEFGFEFRPGPPTAGNGKVYVVFSEMPAGEGWLYCYAASTGDRLWRYRLGDYVCVGAPLFLEGRVYLHGHVARPTSVLCFDGEAGKLLWRTDIGEAPTSQRRPCVRNGKVFLGDYDCVVSCLNAAGGALLWQHTMDKEKDRYLYEMCAGDNKLFVDTQGDSLYCFKVD
ncbi:MAG: PQQ-binding-like beta-propeller repeat protein [bacterium]